MRRSKSILVILGGLALAGVVDRSPVDAQIGVPRILAFSESIKGNEEVELRWPVAVAAASAEEIAVADAYGPRLMSFRKVGVSWQVDKVVDLPGTPVDLTHHGNRWVVSLRQSQGLVALEGPDLRQRKLQLPAGVVPGALAVVPNGDLLVYDYADRRVLRLSSDGEVATVARLEKTVAALAATAAGGFLAAVPEQGSVLSFDANGDLGATWELPAADEIPAWPVGLTVEPGGEVVAVDRHAGRLLVLDATGGIVGLGSRKGWEPGLLLYPAGMARLPNGHLLVADEGNGRAQVFRRTD